MEYFKKWNTSKNGILQKMEYFKKWNTSKNGLLNKSNYGKKSNYGTVRVTTVL